MIFWNVPLLLCLLESVICDLVWRQLFLKGRMPWRTLELRRQFINPRTLFLAKIYQTVVTALATMMILCSDSSPLLTFVLPTELYIKRHHLIQYMWPSWVTNKAPNILWDLENQRYILTIFSNNNHLLSMLFKIRDIYLPKLLMSQNYLTLNN